MNNPLDPQEIGGVILAGGRGTRMGGRDKAMCVLGGQPLIAHVTARLAPQCGPLAINANGSGARFADLGFAVIADTMGDYPGPLAGVLAGLDWAEQRGLSAIVTVAVDTPFFPENLVARLVAARGAAGLALAASQDEDGTVWRHPTFGIWPVSLRADLQDALAGGLRKIVAWTDRHEAGAALWSATPFDPFFNCNTPEDLAAAQARLDQIPL